MILICPNCSTRYRIDADKIPPGGREVRCAKCGNRWHQDEVSEEEQAEETWEPDASETDQDNSFDTALDAALGEEPAAPSEESEPAPEGLSRFGPGGRPAYDEEEAGAPLPLWGRALVGVGWAGLVAVVLAVGWGGYVYRQNIMTNWPQSASLYSTLGLKSSAGSLRFDDSASKQVLEDGQPVLEVSGKLTNTGENEVPMPVVRVGLTDGAYREIYHWTFSPHVLTLKPGQSTRFVTRLSSPPAAARHLELRFAKAGE